MGRHRLVEMVAAEQSSLGQPRRRWSTRTVAAAVGITLGLLGIAGAWALLLGDDGAPSAGSAMPGSTAVAGSAQEILAGSGAESPSPSGSPDRPPTSQPSGTAPAGTRFTADYDRTSYWATGFVAEVVVRNLGDRPARWTVEVTLPPGAWVADVWRADYRQSGEIVLFVAASELAPAASASFGFRIEATSQVSGAVSCSVNGQPCT